MSYDHSLDDRYYHCQLISYANHEILYFIFKFNYIFSIHTSQIRLTLY